MSECSNSHKKPSGKFHHLLTARIVNANPSRNLSAKEAKRLVKSAEITEILGVEKRENASNTEVVKW